MQYKWTTYKNYRLRTPLNFNPDQIAGGCGPGEWGDALVPDSILGIDISPACDIHDYCYLVGKMESEKVQADIELFANGFRIIKQKSNKIMLFPRIILLSIYFTACIYGGEEAFKS